MDMTTDPKLFFVTATVKTTTQGVELMKTFEKIKNNLEDYSNWTKVLYRFKVTGEPLTLAVIEVYNVIGLERSMAGLSLVGNVEVTCVPIIPYEKLARGFGLADHLLKEVPFDVSAGGDIHLLEFSIDNYTMSTGELIEIWKEEANFILTARNAGLNIILYKVVAERKVIVFTRDIPEKLDMMSFKIPLMQKAGGNTVIKCRALQDLASYTKDVSS